VSEQQTLDLAVLGLIGKARGAGRIHALATTKSGQPRHPLYLAGNLTPKPWEMPGA
jgi:hypothetical protein